MKIAGAKAGDVGQVLDQGRAEPCEEHVRGQHQEHVAEEAECKCDDEEGTLDPDYDYPAYEDY